MSLLELQFRIDQLKAINPLVRSQKQNHELQHLSSALRDQFSSYGDYLLYITSSQQEHY